MQPNARWDNSHWSMGWARKRQLLIAAAEGPHQQFHQQTTALLVSTINHQDKKPVMCACINFSQC